MKKIYINGRYLTDEISGGIERFAREVVNYLSQDKNIKLIILCPKNAILEKNTDTIKYKKIGLFKGNLWEQISLPIHMLFRRSYILNMCNSFPIFRRKSAIVFHDMRNIEELRSGNRSKTNKKIDLMIRKSTHKKTKVFVDSKFTKDRLFALYPKYKNNVSVLKLGYEHCEKISPNRELDDKLKKENYYLTVNSLSKHKNVGFIFRLAKLHTDKNFYLIGKNFDENEEEIPSNVKFLGKLEDNDMASYYKNCKAFISPSLYEGFGLTPLEAIYFGTKSLFLSDIDVFKEVYGSVASFFNPYDEKLFIFDEKIISSTAKCELLQTYSWKNCAEDIKKSIFGK